MLEARALVAGEQDSIVLSVGFWAAYPCDDRMLRVFSLSLLVLALIAGFAILIMSLKLSLQYPATHGEPLDRRSNSVIIAFGVVVLVVFALVPTIARTQTSLVATKTNLIETGCQFRKAYAEIYDRSRLTIEYQFKRGKNSYDWLSVKQEGKRRITIPLGSDSDLKNLIAIAPDAMRDYANQLRAEGETLPVELERL